MYRLREEGHETFTIGPEKGKVYNSKHGMPCKADYGVDEIRHEVISFYELVYENKVINSIQRVYFLTVQQSRDISGIGPACFMIELSMI